MKSMAAYTGQQKMKEQIVILKKSYSVTSGLVKFAVLGMISFMGCGSGVLLYPQGEEGGVAKYLYQEHHGPMRSPNRTEALRQISRYCLRSYTIIKEGSTRGRKRVVEGVAGADVITETWWGIKFRCDL